MFLNSFNHYRAVAIVFIVAGHSYDLAGVVVDTFIERFVANFLQGGLHFLYLYRVSSSTIYFISAIHLEGLSKEN